MVDSDILIWILRGKDEFRTKFLKLADQTNGMMFITPIQIAEIHSGLRRKETARTVKLLDSLITINIEKTIGERAGTLMLEYRKSHNVTLADALIAASAVTHELLIWTLNRKHYPMIEESGFVD